MNLALGIDTGGTYTDAALMDHDTGRLLAGAKALTTRHDLSIGIAGAIEAVFASAASIQAGLAPTDVVLVALSTTLATNTLAEGQTGSVSLILIGYDVELMNQYGFHKELSTRDVVYVRGGHDLLGNEVAPLDETAARAAILARRDTTEAFAVSGYFGVRNPAHENRVRALIQELTDRPVTCGHELTSRLNAVRRATTVALNAHLILPLRELIASVQTTLASHDIAAPLMVVKGDGSLMRADWAMRRPIETILSGPAASVVGAWHLAPLGERGEHNGRGPSTQSRSSVWVVDVGGTTTDIGALRDGWPVLNPDGARVAGWRTMVEAIDVHTTGLGGDSHVRLDTDRALQIGPRRVVPLCLLASQHPEIVAVLRRHAEAPLEGGSEEGIEFLVPGRHPGSQLSEQDAEVLRRLESGPKSIAALTHESRIGGLYRRSIAYLETQGLVRRAGFTPTDALHALGRFDRWDAGAARLAASVLAAQAEMPVEAFCKRVVEGVSDRVATELVSKVLEDEGVAPVWDQEPVARRFLAQAFDGAGSSDLGCQLTLRRPLVAIGAPVAAYMPGVAERLHTGLIIPDHAEVANAVGAVSGGIIQRVRVLINPLDGAEDRLRVHLPDGIQDFDELEGAVAYANQRMTPYVAELARQAGAEQIETRATREDHWAPVLRGRTATLYLGSELVYSAVGRPSPARRD